MYNSNVDDTKTCFIIILKCLDVFGFYPLPGRSWFYNNLYTWFAFSAFVFLFPMGQCLYVYNKYGTENIIHLIAVNGVIFETIIVASKVLYMRKNVQKMHELIEELNDEIYKSENVEHAIITTETRKMILSGSILYFSSCTLFVVFLMALPVILKTNRLPIDIDIPFINEMENPFYLATYIWEFVALIFLVAAGGGYDLLSAATLLWIGGKIDLLAHDLDNLKVQSKNNSLMATEEELQPIYRKFHRCIKKHNAIKE